MTWLSDTVLYLFTLKMVKYKSGVYSTNAVSTALRDDSTTCRMYLASVYSLRVLLTLEGFLLCNVNSEVE